MTISPPGLALGSSFSSWASAGGSPRTSAIADAAIMQGKRFILSSFALELFQSDAGIDERCDDVGNEVAENDRAGRDQRDPHDDWNVDALDCLPSELSDAGPAENAF